jgi:hypothetical protein
MWELKLAAAGRAGEERFCLEISLSQIFLMDDYGHDLGDNNGLASAAVLVGGCRIVSIRVMKTWTD